MVNLDMLNDRQREAVLQTEGPVLILAGAGSGKTRVLTQRIAYLIEEKQVNPWNILAITFTNKAAQEMRERVDSIVGFGAESIWVSTFHSTCVRILRRYIDRLGFDTNFTIYDTDDSKSVMKEVCKRLNIDTKIYKERALLSEISSAKDELISPEEYNLNTMGDFSKRRVAEAYREYQDTLKKNNALDFDDLIVKTVELFRMNPDVLDSYQERFRYISVDEYQDTNTAQFELVRLLSQKYRNLCVVGDDDQSIYKFRGANIRNILDFEKVFPEAKVVKLEQNYRSTGHILNAANGVIRCNEGRKDKKLWTENGDGEKVHFRQYDQAYEEADGVVKEIRDTVLAHPQVVGMHDLIIHDYGPGRRLCSFHAEVPQDADILDAHDAIDHIEREIKEKFGIETTVHMDPIATADEKVNQLRRQVADLARVVEPEMTIHDFRVVRGPTHTNVIFDAVVPHKCRLTDEEVLQRLRQAVSALDPAYQAVIQIDRAYVE